MPVFTQHNMLIAGNVVDIVAYAEAPGLLYIQPGTFVEIPEWPLAVRKGVFTVTVGSLDKDHPSTFESGRTSFNCLPVTIDVFRVGSPDIVASATTRADSVLAPTPEFPNRDYQTHLDVDAGSVNESARYSRSHWKVRLTNNTTRIAQVGWQIRYIRDSSLITEDKIPISLLNNTFGLVLNALSPKATVRGKTLTIQISPEIAEFSEAVPASGVINHDLSGELPVDAYADLISLGVELVSGTDVLREVDALWARRDAILRSLGATSPTTVQVAANNRWREEWHDKVDATDVAVKLHVVLSDIPLVLGRLWTETIVAGEIEDASAKIFLTFKSHTAFLAEQFGKGHALVVTPAHYEGILVLIADLFGQVPDIGAKIEEFANKAIPIIHRYFAEVLIRMVHSQYQKRFIDCRISGEDVIVRFSDDPTDADAFPREAPVPTDVTGDGGGLGGRHVTHTDVGGIRDVEGVHVDRDAVQPEPLGVVPAGFNLGSPESLLRLENINTIVVVMMENRSFDHLLGRLSRKWPDRGYICYPDEAFNSVPGHSPIRMVPARNVEHRTTYYALPIDPYHGTDHVLRQINGGKMDGFAGDIMTKPDAIDRNPQMPLTYYDDADLPFYYYLAEQYTVCDQWFAAHPGGTYPNRWAFLSGVMVQLKNFPVDDRRMGFIKAPTIFDYLDQAGIEWIYYESNIGMLRMYDRYRLDTTRVLPYDHPERGFPKLAKDGHLPPVVFIEPKITGIPPLAQASDDHPPANLLRGQEFFNRAADKHGPDGVYTALRSSPQWPRSMLVVTYDEHGGFYDHVPPPGTPLGDPAWRQEGFKLIHPSGQKFLGPRVPTFIVSPFVEPGSVTHHIFDHTSVVKTILVKFRSRFHRNIFSLFGERVPQISHLGEALTRTTPRADSPAAPQRRARTQTNYGDVPKPPITVASLPLDVRGDADEVSYGFSLARAMMPKR